MQTFPEPFLSAEAALGLFAHPFISFVSTIAFSAYGERRRDVMSSNVQTLTSRAASGTVPLILAQLRSFSTAP